MVFVAEQWLLFSILFILVAALLFVESKKRGKALSYHEVTRLVNSGEGIIVDVRDDKEFRAGHITNAVNIPYAKLQTRLSELAKHKSKVIIVVDKMGQHAGSAGKILKDNEYNAMRMQGGMVEWQGQNLPVVK